MNAKIFLKIIVKMALEKIKDVITNTFLMKKISKNTLLWSGLSNKMAMRLKISKPYLLNLYSLNQLKK